MRVERGAQTPLNAFRGFPLSPHDCRLTPHASGTIGHFTSYFSIRTSVDLITAVTESPTFNPIDSAELRVFAETISMSPLVTITSAIMPPSLMDLIVPLNWFRALNI